MVLWLANYFCIAIIKLYVTIQGCLLRNVIENVKKGKLTQILFLPSTLKQVKYLFFTTYHIDVLCKRIGAHDLIFCNLHIRVQFAGHCHLMKYLMANFQNQAGLGEGEYSCNCLLRSAWDRTAPPQTHQLKYIF